MMGCQRLFILQHHSWLSDLIEGEAKSQVDKLEQACEGSANEDHLQITNQKYTRDVKRTIKTSDMALLFHSPSPFAIFDVLINCEFPLIHELCFL